jgi:hypothetical protein
MVIEENFNLEKRQVYCEDAISWLLKQAPENYAGCSIVTSLPDISEFPQLSLESWKKWFIETASLILSKIPDEGVAIFYQTDIKWEGTWVDKGHLCQQASDNLNIKIELLWHKIICGVPPGIITFGKPSYSHLLCFSKGQRSILNKSTADVIPHRGDKVWPRGMSLEACLIIARFISEQTSTQTIINPFCGKGSMLAAANLFGLQAIGIERSTKRAQIAREITVSQDMKTWVV